MVQQSQPECYIDKIQRFYEVIRTIYRYSSRAYLFRRWWLVKRRAKVATRAWWARWCVAWSVANSSRSARASPTRSAAVRPRKAPSSRIASRSTPTAARRASRPLSVSRNLLYLWLLLLVPVMQFSYNLYMYCLQKQTKMFLTRFICANVLCISYYYPVEWIICWCFRFRDPHWHGRTQGCHFAAQRGRRLTVRQTLGDKRRSYTARWQRSVMHGSATSQRYRVYSGQECTYMYMCMYMYTHNAHPYNIGTSRL